MIRLGPRSLHQQHPWCCPLSGCWHYVPTLKLRKSRSLWNSITMETHSPAPATRQSRGTLLGILFLLMTKDGGSVLMGLGADGGSACAQRWALPVAGLSPAHFTEDRAWFGTRHVPIRQPWCCPRGWCGQQQVADAGCGDAGGNLLCAD